MAKAEEKWITVNGVRLRYLDWGTEGKTPLVCLHGHVGQAHIWDEFAEAMSASYHVYTLDQRGHGGSQRATDGYDRERFVEDLDAFVDGLAPTKVALVGLSMGGWNCLLYALDHLDRVDRIVLVDIVPEPSEAFRQQSTARPPTPLEFDSFEEAFAWARQGNLWATDERIRWDMANRLRRRDDGTWTWKADSVLFNTPLRDFADPELAARYWRSIETSSSPILVVRGKGSILISDEILERLSKANPRLTAVDVEGAGHVVPVDRPQEFISATRSFLSAP